LPPVLLSGHLKRFQILDQVLALFGGPVASAVIVPGVGAAGKRCVKLEADPFLVFEANFFRVKLPSADIEGLGP